MNYDELLSLGKELSLLNEGKTRKISQDLDKLQTITMSSETFSGLVDEFLKAADTSRKLTKSEIRNILNKYFNFAITNKEIQEFEKTKKMKK